MGKLQLAWVPNNAFGGVKGANVEVEAEAEAEAEGHASDGESLATVGGEERSRLVDEPMGGAVDADMDVAEDEDQWL